MNPHSQSRLLVVLFILAAAIMIIGVPAGAAAADGKVDIAGGYSFERITNEPATNFPGCWFAAVGFNVVPMFDVVADFSGARKTESETVQGVSVDESVKMYGYLFGPRVRSNPGMVRVFGQVLFGGHTIKASGSASAAGRTVSVDSSENDFAVQPGGGVDVKINDQWSARGGVNYRLVRPKDSGDWGKVLQVIAGIVYNWK